MHRAVVIKLNQTGMERASERVNRQKNEMNEWNNGVIERKRRRGEGEREKPNAIQVAQIEQNRPRDKSGRFCMKKT